MEATPRQLIVCCDGTNNNLTGGRADTNVVKMLPWMGRRGSNQVVFYDPGVGNAGTLPGATLWDGFARKRERIEGLALGRGVYENVAECYLFLMANYREDDQIFFFGFSRGAFTARSVAGIVHQFGILPGHMQSLVPTLLHAYFSSRKGTGQDAVNAIAKDIRANFCADRQPVVHFVGVWDTVASVGMWPFAARMTARPTIKGKRFVHVRQALALDEHRGPFKPRVYLDNAEDLSPGQTVVQRWFRGAHCDAGGGYLPARSVISNEALAWMLTEAKGCGLRLDMANVPAITREAVLEALNPELIGKPPIIHSETYDNCLWAIGGLTVRDTTKVDIDGESPGIVKAVEHESVVNSPLEFKKNTVWARPRPLRDKLDLMGLALVMGAIFMGMGMLLSLPNLTSFSEVWDAARKANTSFAQWQLLWWMAQVPDVRSAIPGFLNPRLAIVADLLFIMCYATILAWWVAWSFARIARFNRGNARPPRFLNLLGRALPALVFADIAEDVLTFLTLWAAPEWGRRLSLVLGAAMSLASLVKWVGLAGVATLLLWSFVPRRD
jgi:hypothetical protein